jgi:DNA polymerase-1
VVDLPNKGVWWVSVDTETTGLHPDDGAHIICVSVAGDDWQTVIPFDVPGMENSTPKDWGDLTDWLWRQNLVMHNAKFDLMMFAHGAPPGCLGVDLSARVQWDTQLAEWVQNPLLTRGLKDIGARRFGAMETAERDVAQKWLVDHGFKKGEIWKLPPELLIPYAQQDADLTFRVFKEQQLNIGPLMGPHYGALLGREMAVMRTLFKMETRGIGFRTDKAVEIESQLRDSLAVLRDALPFKPTRQKAIAYWIAQGYDRVIAGLPKTATGRPSLDDKARATIWSGTHQEPKLPCAPAFFQYLDIDLALSRYYGPDGWRGLVGQDGRLRPVYRQDGTTSMRFSCSRVNLQAIPQDWKTATRYQNPRSLFVPKPGYHLVELDLSQAEMRVATAVSGCRAMRKIIDSGQDIHSATCTELFGIGPDAPDWDKQRHISKVLNFAVLYGAGPHAVVELLSDRIEMDESQAKRLIAAHRRRFPEFFATSLEAQATVETRGYVTLISRRRRYFEQDENPHKAFNAVIQGNVAEFMKDEMLWIDKYYPGILLLQIHDSVVLEIPLFVPRSGVLTDLAVDPSYIAKNIEYHGKNVFGIPMICGIKEFGGIKEHVGV